MKKTYNLFILIIIFSFLLGCSSEKNNSNTQSQNFQTNIYPDDYPYYKFKTPVTMKDSIEMMLNIAIERQRYNDKSGMYELEFGYLTDQVILDQYIRDKRIMHERDEVINKAEVIDVHRFNYDSASVDVKLYIKNAKNEIVEIEQQIIVYYYMEQWIRPTLSKVESEVQYQNTLKKSIEQLQKGGN
jgi:hypothetical protein